MKFTPRTITKNRWIHIAGLAASVAAIMLLSAGQPDAKAIIAMAVASVGVLSNIYGIYRPNTFLR